MALADELAYMTATDMAARIRRRQLSPVEVVDAVIERIEQRNPSLNAFVFKGYDDARRRAEQAEHAVLAGEELGPLHGVPTAMKDLFDFKPGWPATFGGVRAFKDLVIDAYCVFAERIERAGAILIGKTNSPVLGFRGVTDNYLFGPTSNPFDTSVNTGGSSGGSAAAVADGLVPFAEGTDGGGSIRIPAAWCGVYGYKASFGRVPMVMRPDAFAATNPFIYEGPLARTVEDAALVLNALSGYDARDPYSLDEDVDFLPATRRSIRGLRIAYSPDLDVYPVDPRIAQVVREAVDSFKEAGAHVEEVKLGLERDQRELSDLWCRLIIPLSCVAFERMRASGFDVLGEHRDDFPPEFLHWVDSGMDTTVLEQSADQEMRTEVYDALQGVLGTYDLLVTPTVAAMQVKNGTDGNTLGPAEVNGVEVDRLIGWCMTYFCNFSGHPAASIPAGFADGLPVGMQIIGRRHADADVLAASAAFERLRPWHDSYARCAERPLS
jgi:amidase/aspartyl-tRNA(Asn)/glutamyl-tRNA(Gln) amidotransferase subunit A